MAPIYDSDLAHERYKQSEWKSYELWEDVEHRLWKRKRLWIVLTIFIFILLSSVPILMEHYPKWKTFDAVRILAQEINRIKTQAAIEHGSFLLKFTKGTGLSYQIERVTDCKDHQGQVWRSGTLVPDSQDPLNSIVLLSPEKGEEMDIPGLIESFCFSPFMGFLGGEEQTRAIVLIPVKDLAVKRLDRYSILFLSGASAEISFD